MCAPKMKRKHNTKHSCNRRVYIYRVLSACVWSTLETVLFDDDWEEPWVISAYAQRLTRNENSITFLFLERYVFHTGISRVSADTIFVQLVRLLFYVLLCWLRKWVQRQCLQFFSYLFFEWTSWMGLLFLPSIFSKCVQKKKMSKTANISFIHFTFWRKKVFFS